MSGIDQTRAINRRITWLLVLANVSVPAWLLLQRNNTNLSDTATIWVGWISAAFITTLLLVSTYLRRPVEIRAFSKSMIWTAIGLVILSGFITTIVISSNPSDNYLPVALSDVPLVQIRPARKRIVVELIRRDKAASDENSRRARSMKPISPALYSVDSFASKGTMEATIEQFKQASAIDMDYETAKSDALKDFHDEMAQVDSAYLESFEADLRKKNAAEVALEATDAKWVTSTLNLYNYAIAHSDQISMSKTGHLVIGDEEIRQSVLMQLNDCRSLQDSVTNQREKAVDDQNARQDAEGIKHTD